jgi:hypothetical protein
MKFPLIKSAHKAVSGNEMTPERVAEILLQQEVDWLVR